MSQQCDGNKDCDTGKDEANCTGSQQLISAKHEIAFRFIQIKCNFNVVTVVTLGLLMQLLDGYLLILATAVTKHLIVNHYDEADDNFAWLVTPIIFGIGCIYATYKCLKEGFCTIQRLRRDAAGEIY